VARQPAWSLIGTLGPHRIRVRCRRLALGLGCGLLGIDVTDRKDHGSQRQNDPAHDAPWSDHAIPPLRGFCPYRPQSFLTRVDAIVGSRDARRSCRAVNAAVQTWLRRPNTAAERFLSNRSYADGRPFTIPA